MSPENVITKIATVVRSRLSPVEGDGDEEQPSRHSQDWPKEKQGGGGAGATGGGKTNCPICIHGF